MKLKLIDKKKEAKDTFSFFFEPERDVKWLPGQFFYFTIPKLKYNDPKGNTRHFTISASPTEGKTLRITTRLREDSGYKKTLNELLIGTLIEGEGPNGTFILDENEKGKHVLIAGGIGITPFRAFIKYNIDKNLNDIQLHLIYSNSIPEEIAFYKELSDWETSHKNIKIALTISKPEESETKWDGLKGRIDELMIEQLLNKWGLKKNEVVFWLCGPPPMVDAIENVLGKMGITSDKIRSEKFTGY